MNHPGRLPLHHPPPPLRAADRARSGRLHLFGRGGDRARARPSPPTRSSCTPRASTWPSSSSSQGGAPVAGRAARSTPTHDQLVITAERPLPAGDAVLELRFDGADQPRACSASTAAPTSTRRAPTQVLAATQFEAPHARAAFPCFDEPEFKAIFAITLVVADGLLALSNGPEIDREQPPRRQRARPIRGDDPDVDVSRRVGRRAARGDRARRRGRGRGARRARARAAATSHASRSTSARSRSRSSPTTTASRIPGEKCDLVALPDFSFGAMENLGCVTFRETRLLLDPDAVTLDEMSARRAHDRARDRAHVVRRPRHHEVVERHLAERGVRHVHGAPRRRRVQAGVEDLGRVRARPRGRARRRRAREHPHRRVRGRHARGRRRHVRHPHVPKGRLGPAHARALARRRRVPRRRAALPRPLPAREHRDHRSLGRARRRRPASRCAASWTRGSSNPASRRCGSTTADSSSAGSPTRRPGTTSSGCCRCWRACTPAPGSETRSLLVRREAAAARRRRRRAGGAQRGRRRLLPRRVPGRSGATGCSTRACSNRSNGSRSSTTSGRRCSRATRPRPSSSRAHAGSPARPIPSCGARSSGTCAPRPGSSKATRSTRMRAEIAAIVGPDDAAPRLGRPRRRRRARASCAACSSTCSVRTPTIPETIARAREVYDRGGADADVQAAAISVVASNGDRRRLRAVRRARGRRPRTRRSSCATSTRSATSRARSSCCAPPSSRSPTTIRAQNGPFVVQRALRNREHGAAVWAFVRDNWERVRSPLQPVAASRA